MPLPIETDRLVIRLFRESDADAMFDVWGDPQVMRYIPSGPYQRPEDIRPRLERLARFHEHGGRSLWAVCLRRPTEESMWDRPIGAVGIVPVAWEGPETELAFHLAREFWGLGLATEAGAACLAYGFVELGLDRIIGLTFRQNTASHHVLRKLGMSELGPTTAYYGMELLKFEKTSEV